MPWNASGKLIQATDKIAASLDSVFDVWSPATYNLHGRLVYIYGFALCNCFLQSR